MSKRAEEAALKAYPEKIIDHVEEPGFVVKRDLNRFDRNVYIQGYEQAEKDIITLIESRISEIIGDAQPKPALRVELQDLIKRIKEEQNGK